MRSFSVASACSVGGVNWSSESHRPMDIKRWRQFDLVMLLAALALVAYRRRWLIAPIVNVPLGTVDVPFYRRERMEAGVADRGQHRLDVGIRLPGIAGPLARPVGGAVRRLRRGGPPGVAEGGRDGAADGFRRLDLRPHRAILHNSPRGGAVW